MLRILEGAIARKGEENKEAIQRDVEYLVSGGIAVKQGPPKAMNNRPSMRVDMLE